jgi:stage III sporulation protein SpoIIIAA
MNKVEFYEDLEKLYKVLPPKVLEYIKEKDLEDLVEIVLDLGRVPEIRRSDGKIEYLGRSLTTDLDINYLTEKIEDFASDNRSGIPATLHRISAIKNRKGKTIGLTCRIGRVVTGTIFCIKDIVLKNKSILFLGRPGVGKTTKLREIARMLSEDMGKRVVVVDTSNEIAGDGDVPHKAIGTARRMQVPTPERQKDIMIEAVQNHTPEVIVVDEIGTEEEALAARTIAERGVMLIATAHGNTLENLIKNPTLSDLIGGVNSVTLGDDEARRRATQKTILEREKKPTFDIVIEIVDRDTLSIYTDVAEAVDYMLREWPITPEIRRVDQEAPEIKTTEKTETEIITIPKIVPPDNVMSRNFNVDKYIKDVQDFKKVYIYAVNRAIVDKAIERLEINAEVTRSIDDADLVIAHKSYSKGGAKILGIAKDYRLPVHYVKTNSMPQIQKVLKEALRLDKEEPNEVMQNFLDETEKALDEVKEAVKMLENGAKEVDLKPQNQRIRKLQHELLDQHNLTSKSMGEGKERHLKVVKAFDNAV